jgi:hypothetical protein
MGRGRMTWLDRIILFFAPVLALQREEAKRRLELKDGWTLRNSQHVDDAGWRPADRAKRPRYLSTKRGTSP